MVTVKVREAIGGLNKPNEIKYYGCNISQGIIDSNTFLDEVSKNYHINPADLLKVLVAIADSIPTYLKQGKIVQLKELGTFQLMATTSSADSPKEINLKTVKKPKIIFKPDYYFKKPLENISYSFDRKITKKRKEEIMT
jgi:predicted histone-like DNA-binding protein